MATIKIASGQNLLDIALQEYGSIETVFELMEDNEIYSVSETIISGQEIQIQRRPLQQDVVSYYKERQIQPATAIDPYL